MNAKNIKENSLKPINQLTKKFPNAYQFCNGDTNKCVLFLRKDVYPYKYVDSWKRFYEKLSPDKKAFYSELYLEDITDKDNRHAQKYLKKYLRNYMLKSI